MARATRRPASSAPISTDADVFPPTPPGDVPGIVARLERLYRKFDRAAFGHPGIDAEVVFRPDLRRDEAELHARDLLNVRAADPASVNFAAEQSEQMRATYAAARCVAEWDPWVPPSEESIEQVGCEKYWVRVIAANEFPEFPGPGECSQLWRCTLFGPRARKGENAAVRRFNMLAMDSARLIYPNCQATGKALISLWLIRLADRLEPIVPDSRKQFLEWSTIGRTPMWVPVTPMNRPTCWWAVRLPNVFQLSRAAIQFAIESAPRAPATLSCPTVDLPSRTVTFDGTRHDVSSVTALRWVKVLAEHPGEWISAPELKRHDQELDGVRPDRLKKQLPQELLSLIESDRRKGSRLRLP